jgi:DNA-binding NarL/FixJ family response regulator
MITLLVVDDHPTFVNSLQSHIATEGDFSLTNVVNSVFEAADLVRRELPNVVLMNERLSDGDGLEAAKYIVRSANETSVLMMTEHENNDLLRHVLEEGCAGLVTRDSSLEHITDTLRDAAHGDLVVKFRELPMHAASLQPAEATPSAALTSRERDVLQCLLAGESTSTMSERLFISTSTVRNHVNSILTKMGAHSKLEAVTIANRERFVA